MKLLNMKNKTEKDKVLVNSITTLKKWVVPEIKNISILDTKSTSGNGYDGISSYGTT